LLAQLAAQVFEGVTQVWPAQQSSLERHAVPGPMQVSGQNPRGAQARRAVLTSIVQHPDRQSPSDVHAAAHAA